MRLGENSDPRKGAIDPRFRTRQVSELIPTRASLLRRLRDLGDQEAWKHFFDTYWKLIYGFAINAGLTSAEAEDVLQETLIAVSRRLPDFQYQEKHGSFKSWLLRLTSWRIADQLRQRGLAKTNPVAAFNAEPEAGDPEGEPASYEFEALWDAEWEHCIQEVALERVKRKVNSRMYQVFGLLAFHGWPVAKVCRSLMVNPAYVYLAKHRVGGLLKKELAYLKTKRL